MALDFVSCVSTSFWYSAGFSFFFSFLKLGCQKVCALHVEQTGCLECLQLLPGHGIGGVGNARRIDEQGYRNVVLAHQRRHLGIDRLVSVIRGDHHRFRRRRRPLAAQVVHQRPQRDDRVLVVLEPLELRLEHLGGHRHAIGHRGAEAVVAQNRHGDLIICRRGRAAETYDQHSNYD